MPARAQGRAAGARARACARATERPGRRCHLHALVEAPQEGFLGLGLIDHLSATTLLRLVLVLLLILRLFLDETRKFRPGQVALPCGAAGAGSGWRSIRRSDVAGRCERCR